MYLSNIEIEVLRFYNLCLFNGKLYVNILLERYDYFFFCLKSLKFFI